MKKNDLRKLAIENGIKYSTLQARIARGWTLERALSEPVQGHSPNLHQLAATSGIQYGTLRARVARGWTLERALSEPAQRQSAPDRERGVKVCTVCGIEKPLESFTLLRRRTGTEYQSACRECDNNRTWKARVLLRDEVLSHYGGTPPRCAICNESRIEVLDLDHVDGDGKEDRKTSQLRVTFYKRVRDDGFPEKFRVLCRNCNWIAHLKLHKQGRYRNE